MLTPMAVIESEKQPRLMEVTRTRYNPMYAGSARPAIDEKTRSEQQRSRYACVQTSLRNRLARSLLVLLRSPQVQPVLQWVDQRADEGADGDSELHQAGLKDAEVVRLAECLDHRAEEQEQDTPRKRDPESEENDDRLGEKHLGRALEGDLQQRGYGRLVQLRFSVDFAPCLLAQSLCALLENDIAARFAQDEPEDGNQGGVVDDLNIVNPGLSVSSIAIERPRTHHRHRASSPTSGFRICTIALPINGPSAIPATLVNPNSDMGKLRAWSPFQMSLILPPTMLMATEDAPPPKKRVTTMVAKLSAKAEPNRNNSNTM